MNIGIDIDDTITKISEETDIYAKEYTESILKRKFEPQNIKIFDPMWAKHLYNWTDEENDKFWDLYYEKIMENVKPKEDAVEVINNLSVKNNIIIITARWDRESGIIAKITKEWLKKNKVNYTKIFIGHTDKRKISEECKIDVFIDDSYKTCEQIAGLGIKTYMMDSRINKTLEEKNWKRVYSWKDFEKEMSILGQMS